MLISLGAVPLSWDSPNIYSYAKITSPYIGLSITERNIFNKHVNIMKGF
jgi:hypothetical protein